VMTTPTATAAGRAGDVNWLLNSFADNTAGVEVAVCVSSDGLLMAMTSRLNRADADRLAAIVAGLRSLSDGAARVMGRGGVSQVIVEMFDGYLFTASLGQGASLGVLTASNADLGLVGYAMTLFAQRVGGQLDADVIGELKSSLAR